MWLRALCRITACLVRACRYSELSFVLSWSSPAWFGYQRTGKQLMDCQAMLMSRGTRSQHVPGSCRESTPPSRAAAPDGSLLCSPAAWPAGDDWQQNKTFVVVFVKDGCFVQLVLWLLSVSVNSLMMTDVCRWNTTGLKHRVELNVTAAMRLTCVHIWGTWHHCISVSSLRHSAGTSGTAHSSSGHEEPDPAYSKHNNGTVTFIFR